MRIVGIRETTIPVSRYADWSIASGGLTTSLVAIVTDFVRHGRPVVGYGFASVGRFAQGGLMRERFIPRLLAADPAALRDDTGTNLDPFRAWDVMMANEKPGGHGERCVAVGTLDMALWDAAAKIADLPLHAFLQQRMPLATPSPNEIEAYAGGGYVYPTDDIAKLSEEMRRCRDLGYTHAKIKIGSLDLDQDQRRIKAAAAGLGHPGRLAVDAIYQYTAATAPGAARRLDPIGLWWFEDVCDPLDFPLLAEVAQCYNGPIAAGEALFSVEEARLLHRFGGLRTGRDRLVFDIVHCYGLPGYLRIVRDLISAGWPRAAFWPHGGHLFSIHAVAALGLGGAEINPFAFYPFRGLAEGMQMRNGRVSLPDAPGIGFERHPEAWNHFKVMAE